MKSALRNFVLATAGVAILLLGAWFFVRERALSHPVRTPVSHPFLDRLAGAKPMIIAYQGDSLSAPPNSLPAFEKACALDPNIVLWADVRPTMDGTLVVFEPKDVSSETNGSGWMQFTKDVDLEKLDAGFRFTKDQGQTFPFRGQGLKVLTLKELLAHFPERFFILNFQDYKAGLDERILAVIDEAKAGDRVLISSPEDGILRDLRARRPTWVFGTSQAQATVLLMLSELGLEAAAPIQGDVFVGPSAQGASLFHLSDRIINEIHRRKMKIVLGPAVDGDQARQWRDEGLEGIVTRHPSSLFK